MSQGNLKNWRGFLYISMGLAFGIYRALKVDVWGAWDFFDQALAMAMVASGAYILLRK